MNKKSETKTINGLNNEIKNPSQVWVNKLDIKFIGDTTFEEDGNTSIICDFKTCCIEEILLRSILQCWGKNYGIIKRYEHNYGIVLQTNLPWNIYNSIQ